MAISKPVNPPDIAGITRFGVHHQPTKLVVRFSGGVNLAEVTNPANYTITARGPDGRYGTRDDVRIPITSAIYDASANAVLLKTSRRLNLHYHFAMTVKLGPISTSGNGTDAIMIFGGKQILGGFVGNHGVGTELIPLRSHVHHIGIEADPFNTLGQLVASEGPRGENAAHAPATKPRPLAR